MHPAIASLASRTEAVSPRVRETLGSSFDPRRNSLNALRLVLAGMVIVAHSWALGGYGDDPEFGGLNIGRWAVIGFFTISGFLITRSRIRRSLRGFVRDRVLRIVPAYVVATALIAFVFAPAVAALDADRHYPVGEALAYFLRNLALYPPYLAQYGIGDTLAGLPYPGGDWNGSAWTLFWEGICYIAVAVVVGVTPRRWLGVVLAAGAIGSTALATAALTSFVAVPAPVWNALPLADAFAVGAALYVYRHRVWLTWPVITVAVAGLAAVAMTNWVAPLASLPLALVLFKLSSALPLHRVGARNDISYGVYLYGWPVQMLLALALLKMSTTIPLWAFVIVSLAGTIVLGWASCRLVEQPALRWRTGRSTGYTEQAIPGPRQSNGSRGRPGGRRSASTSAPTPQMAGPSRTVGGRRRS